MKIGYYIIRIYKDDEKTNINFENLLETINRDLWSNESEIPSNWNRRARVIDKKTLTIFEYQFTSLITEQSNERIIPIGQFRDEKPFTSEVRNRDFDEIKDSIVEVTTMYFNKSNSLVVLQYNDKGAKKNDIEKYFSSYLPDNYYIKMTPIINKQTLDLIKETNQITALNISLKTSLYDEKIIKKSIIKKENEENHIIKNLLNAIKSSFNYGKEISADSFDLSYGIEYKQNKTMDLNILRKLIDVLNIGHDSIDDLSLRYKNKKKDELQNINLKKMNIDLKSDIDIKGENPAPKFIADTIYRDVGLYPNEIDEAVKEIKKDINPYLIDLPDLYLTPREEHTIKIDNSDEV